MAEMSNYSFLHSNTIRQLSTRLFTFTVVNCKNLNDYVYENEGPLKGTTICHLFKLESFVIVVVVVVCFGFPIQR